MVWSNAEQRGQQLADQAVASLIDEALLTPKPGLVDSKSSGSHNDMDVSLMLVSARSLHSAFATMGLAAYGRKPTQELRETLARIGREGERRMLQTTGGINTHRGAIWALGLLIASAAICSIDEPPERIAAIAGTLAQFPDRYALSPGSNGARVMQTYGIKGARGEAMDGFPHVVKVGLPVLRDSRRRSIPEEHARLNALLAIMACLDDTCLIHRGGMETLRIAKLGAWKVLDFGGASSVSGWEALQRLDQELLVRNASPGGSADLLAATLFLDCLSTTPLQVEKMRGAILHGTADVSI